MKRQILLIFFILSNLIFSQEKSSVFLFDIRTDTDEIQLSGFQKISETSGYTNQPSFISDRELVFSSQKKEDLPQIVHFNLKTNRLKTVFHQAESGAYSPQAIPGTTDIAAVRLHKNGKQALYLHSSKDEKIREILPDLQVAYYVFYDAGTILATVLNGKTMDLVLIDPVKNEADTLFHNAGRSLQKVPKSEYLSYTLVNENGKLDLYFLDMKTREHIFILELPGLVQDYLWINPYQILIGMNNWIFLKDLMGSSEWRRMAAIEKYNISNITRMAVSPDGKKIAVVGSNSEKE